MYKLIFKLIFILSLQQLFAQSEIITKYTTYEGLPVQTIYDCTQDTLGNMWFAADGGLIKYDGTNWEYIDSLYSGNERLDFAFLRMDKYGTLWAFPQPFLDEIFVYNGTRFDINRNINIGNSRELIVAVDFHIKLKDTTIAMLTNPRNVFIYINGKNYKIDFEKYENITPYDIDLVDSTLFISTDFGMFEINLTSLNKNNYTLSSRFNYNSILATNISKSTDGNTKYLILTKEILILKTNKRERVIKNDLNLFYRKNSSNYLFVKQIDQQRYFWGSKFEAFLYNTSPSKLTPINDETGYTTTGTTSIYVDKEKNTWLTSLRGINKIRYSPFLNYSSSDGLLQSEVTAIEKFPSGTFAFAHNSGISLFDGKEIKSNNLFKNRRAGSSTRILNLQYDEKRQVIWFISQAEGIGYIGRSGKVVMFFNDLQGNPRLYSSIYIAEDGNIFFTDQEGIYILKEEKSIQLHKNTSLNTRKIASYDKKNLILATRIGIGLFDIESTELTIVSANETSKNSLYDFFKLTEKEWLVGSYGGLLVFDGKSLKPYEKLDITNPVFFIGQENDFIWFGLMGGALRWNPETGEKKLFTISEGLAGNETNRDAFFYDGENVYIGTDKGLSVFLPKVYDKSIYDIKPRLYVVDITDDNNFHYSLSDKISVPFNKNNITIEYRSPSFVNEYENKFQIHLINTDESSSEVIETDKSSYSLRNINPGEYKIGLSVINANGVSSDTLYTAGLTVKPPFYFEGWFIATLILISLTITYSFYDFINRNRYSRKLELEVERRTNQLNKSEQSIRILSQKLISAQEEERERIARELHDNIAQDLALIKTELDKNTSKTFGNEINSQQDWLSQKVTELTKYVRDMAFFLHPNAIQQIGLLNAVQSLCTEQSKFSAIKIDFFSNLSEGLKLDNNIQTNIYRFIQESLTNIRKHSKAKNAIVIMMTKENVLSIRIEDDGIGFNISGSKSNNNKKMGLQSMEERIRLINGNLSIKSVEGEGTKISAQITLDIIDQSGSEAKSDHLSGS